MKKNVISSLKLHNSQLCSSLYAMQKEGKFCDVTLQCNEKSFLAHRNILAAQSQYVCNMLEEKEKVQNDGKRVDVINLPIDASAMQIVLDFLYTGKAEFSQDDIANVMKAAHILHLHTMYDCCRATLLETINPQNYFYCWTLADLFDDESLQESTVNYVAQNFLTLMEGRDFMAITVTQMKLLLASEDLFVASQDKVLEAIVLWVKHSKSEREIYLSALLRFVQFEKLSKAYIQVLVDEEAIVWESPELMKHVTKTVCTRYLHGTDLTADSPTDGSGTSMNTNEETEPAIAIFGESEDKHIILQCYSIEDDEWSPPEELPLTMSNLAIVEHSGIVYLIGGKQNKHYLPTLFSYHIIDSKLSECPAMNVSRSHAGAAILLGQLYIVGGYNESGFLTSVECYNPLTEDWMQIAPISEPRCGIAVTSLNRRLYAVGGRAENSKTPMPLVECFEVTTGQWTQINSLPFGRSHCGIAVLQHHIYIIGGYTKDDSSANGTMQCYNLLNKKWQDLPVPSIDDWVTATVAYGKHLFVMTDGGQILKFDPLTNTWLDRSLFPTFAGYYVAAVLVRKPVWDV